MFDPYSSKYAVANNETQYTVVEKRNQISRYIILLTKLRKPILHIIKHKEVVFDFYILKKL